MARAIWSGSISFGLVNIPVKLRPAVSRKEVRFHMLHQADGARIQLRRFCSAEGVEVPYEQIVRGYEIARGRYVELTDREIEAADPKGAHAVEILDFVELSEIDPIFYDQTYYLAPDRGASKAYGLLLDAMRSTGKVGIARVVLRTKQALCCVRPMGSALVLATMNYADEIVSADDLELPASGRPDPRELGLAERLVASLSTHFDPGRYRDEHREKLLALVSRKAAGEQVVAAPPARPPGVLNLAEALAASLAPAREEPRRGPAEPNGGARHAPRQEAARRAARPRRKRA